mmetsp:Transcript_62857/g.112081  ORF Transcript_62857/g.112081 Transcript_62857/m.112081 type:complete len:858 (-) Transcript_62857:1195-3768(-)
MGLIGTTVSTLVKTARNVVCLAALAWALLLAYDIRLPAVKIYGPVIHEFDPWFNYRATEYLAEHGREKFFKWFDHMSWYPLGRPVGTTIYPGMQITAVAIWEALKAVPKKRFKIPKVLHKYVPGGMKALRIAPMSLNDVCVYIPAWFGSIATLCVFLITMEVTRSWIGATASALVMSMIPAHLMRSMAGGYDNESIAVTAICLTFYLWMMSVRSPKSWWIGILAGLSYVYMVAAWGGYIFVINMVGVHAAALVPLGYFNSSTYKAYTLFYIIGTLGAMQIPVVGWTPIKSLEQMGPLVVFIIYQLLELSSTIIRRRGLESFKEKMSVRAQVFGVAFVALSIVVLLLWPTGYFGPFSSRIRGLFVKHTKTGNPLVDSVAEHQAASDSAYWQYLHHGKTLAPWGLVCCLYRPTPAKWFIIIYAAVASYFSVRMVRLLIICGPITSVLAGCLAATVLDSCVKQILDSLAKLASFGGDAEAKAVEMKEADKKEEGKGSPRSGEGKAKDSKDAKAKDKKGGKDDKKKKASSGSVSELGDAFDVIKSHYMSYYDKVVNFVTGPATLPPRAIAAVIVLAMIWQTAPAPISDFRKHCEDMSHGMASPQIMFQSRGRNGQDFIVDDYLESYNWLKAHTPKDARVLAWWDYGYQITGIGQRTSIADGNTWNHEHIATLARCLVSGEKRGHKIIRHIADYVLIWAGGRGDDLAKSPHMARIGTSVFPDICPNNPTCSHFGFHQDHTPTPMMAKSVVYRLHSHNKAPGVVANPALWKEVHTSRYGLVRIFKVLNVSKESKDWVANPANRVCDAPGSWYCSGQYPPALRPLIAKRKDFAQLEDFNKGNREKNAYSKYIEDLNKRGGAGNI